MRSELLRPAAHLGQGLQHHVHHGGLFVLLPGVRLLSHLLRLCLGPALDSVGLSLALQSDGLGLGLGFNNEFVPEQREENYKGRYGQDYYL